jgi:D-glycero-D-manno-heptose 1,7-bisphosphate phosphatase
VSGPRSDGGAASGAAYPLVGDGIWCELKAHVAEGDFAGRPALFLDRDGVVIEEVAYLHDPGRVRLIPGAAPAIRAARAAGAAVVMVTNQAGIGRGYYDWPAFAATQARVEAELAEAGARLDMVLACPYAPAGSGRYIHADHPDRKPNPGMLLRAGARLGLDLAASWMVGDRDVDVAAARAAGLAGALHVATGHGGRAGERTAALARAAARFEVRAVDDVGAAAMLWSGGPPPSGRD